MIVLEKSITLKMQIVPILITVAALLLAALPSTDATYGLDAIQPISVSQFTCLRGQGYEFFIARVWESIGNFDNQGIANIKNAHAAGVPYVDGYIFPCLSSRCASAYNQVLAAIDHVRSNGAAIGMIWMDIERLAWPANQASNRQFILDMVKAAEERGVKPGIYSNNNNWESIVGISWNGVSNLPLWWANYNGDPGFSRFVPFGGWSKPAIHQYSGDVRSSCGVDLDQNYY